MTKEGNGSESSKGLSELILTDPLSELARTSRQRFLLAAIVCLMVSAGGLIPTKIDALGLEFSPPRQLLLSFALLFTLVYFAAEFQVYAWTDFERWRNAIIDNVLQDRRRRQELNPDARQVATVPSLLPMLPFGIKARLFVDFVFPIVLALIVAFVTALAPLIKQ